MKKRYFLLIIIALFCFLADVKALEINDCKVLMTIKETSGTGKEKYICKGKAFGTKNDSIYYSGTNSVINFNNYTGFYISNEGYDLTFNITGNNQITYFHNSNGNKIEVKGKGVLKFREISYVKKYVDGKPIYNYSYNGKVIVTSTKDKYEGSLEQFEDDYEDLIKTNKLPKEFDVNNFGLIQVNDYSKMSPVAINNSWLQKNIVSKLKVSAINGYGIVEYKEPYNELTTGDVILISKDKVDAKYELSVDDVKDNDIADKVTSDLNNNYLVSMYDVNIVDSFNNKSIKSGRFTIKMNISDLDNYEDYQVIYVDDDGNIKEYLNAKVENNYIVFDTNHLSYYGIVAKAKMGTISVIINGDKKDNGLVLKVLFFSSLVMFTVVLIVFMILKSGLLPKKKKKRKYIRSN